MPDALVAADASRVGHRATAPEEGGLETAPSLTREPAAGLSKSKIENRNSKFEK
jgi:hypothetical protein